MSEAGAARPSLLLIGGPTASGKSALAVDVAERFGGVVVNADSMQVYRDLPILTAWPAADLRARAPHRLYGVLDGALRCSAGRWRAMALAEIERIRSDGALPILVGGTGLYFRALILLPWAVSEVVTATMWTVMLEPSWGFFNGVLEPLGAVAEGHVWLNKDWALFWLSIAFTWHIAPLGTFFFLAALQTIPQDLYNAARIDRAGVLSRFWHVTLPHIRYAVLIVLVVVTVEAFRQFDLVFAMTSGGPGTTTQILPLLIFRYNFQFSQYGLASSASFILIIIATILAVAYFVLMTRRGKQGRTAAPLRRPAAAT